jgi:prepilin-type N-terminal cleavage/methylation domain-containing protein
MGTNEAATRGVGARGQRGFSFIEILIVMAIISVLVGAVVVVIPRVQAANRRTGCMRNLQGLATLMQERSTAGKGWPMYNGKNFVLAPIATNQIDASNPQNLEVFFCPGDVVYTLDLIADKGRYKALNSKALESGDHREMTSYAGRRNREKEFRISPKDEQRGVYIMSDDDDGALHHTDGIIIASTNMSVRLVEWETLDMRPPEEDEARFLGDDAQHDDLRALSSN